jgi:hypothetical protein
MHYKNKFLLTIILRPFIVGAQLKENRVYNVFYITYELYVLVNENPQFVLDMYRMVV